jgi:hypothetical protein
MVQYCQIWDCWSLFFEEDNTSVTVTSARYIEMLNTFLLRQLRRHNVNMQQIWFQQEGATAHTARASMQVARDMFPQHVISRDYFLWGTSNQRYTKTNPATSRK